MPQLVCLPSVQPGRDGERSVHAHDAGVEIEFRYALEAARRTLLDAHATSFAVVDQNLVHSIRTLGPHDAWLRADEVTVVARITGAATETAAGLLDRLLFRERLNYLILRSTPAGGRQHCLLNAREVREIRHVHAVQIEQHVNRNGARLQQLPA